MLLRLSRVSFWLAAAAAALTLLAPGGHETLLTGTAVAASAAAFGLWRSGVAVLRRCDPALAAVPEPVVLTEAMLRDAAAMLQRGADEAASFDAALHAVARVLRAELGARGVNVHEVRGIDATHAQVADRIEAQPDFRARARSLRLDAIPLGLAIRTGVEAGAPPSGVAVPVLSAGRVVAVIELSGIEVRVEAQAQAGLLRLARLTLSRRAPRAPDENPGHNASHLHGQALVVEDAAVQRKSASRMLQRAGCRVTSASGMLEGLTAPCATRQRFRELDVDDQKFKLLHQGQMLAPLRPRLRAPAGSPESDASLHGPSAPLVPPEASQVLDPAALARLGELDPTGESQLLARVLRAFQTSVARLRPQADAARAGGDQAGVRLVAHTLKSSSASIGALHLSQLCAQIETTIRTATNDDLDTQLDAFGAELDAVLAAIEQLLEERA